MGALPAILWHHPVWAEIQQDVRMLPVLDDVGHALTPDEEVSLLSACLSSRSRLLYSAVMLALNTGIRYSEIRLLQWRQVDFAPTLTVGKSKTRSGAGRAIPLNSRIVGVLEMWASHFPNRQANHYVFPCEKYGASGEEDRFGFMGDAIA